SHLGPATALNHVAFGNGQFVASGYWSNATSGLEGNILTSTNGLDWMKRQSRITNSLGDIAYGNGQFVALGSSGTVVISRDGVNWVQQQTGANIDPSAITYGNGQFVAVGSDGKPPVTE